MRNPSPETIMRQAHMTARLWLEKAKEDVEDLFPEYSRDHKVTLMAAYINAAGLDELAMTTLSVADELESVAGNIYSVAENLSGISSVAESIQNVAATIDQKDFC